MLIEQTLHLLKTVLEQNYFQHNNQFYQLNKGITMGSPISSTLCGNISKIPGREVHKTLPGTQRHLILQKICR